MALLEAEMRWVEAPAGWHQQLARVVSHRYSSFDELRAFAADAKRAGVSALMLVAVQKTQACPGPWYDGIHLCEHINGAYPVEGGNLSQWQDMVRGLRPMRLMWWMNPTHWSVQGPVWAEAVANQTFGSGRWFDLGPANRTGATPCSRRRVADGSARERWHKFELPYALRATRLPADALTFSVGAVYTTELGLGIGVRRRTLGGGEPSQ